MSHPREEILSRLRRAGGGAPEPREDGFTHPGKSVPNLSLFMERAHEAGATVMVSSREQAGRTLMEYLGSDVAAQMVFSDEPVVQSIRTQLEAAGVSNTRAEKPLRTFTQDKLTRVCMKASVGLTGVDQAVSSTGTLLLSNRVERPEALSLLPEHHVAVVLPEQLVSSVHDVMSGRLFGETIRSVLITGPSRTADIEKTLVVGMHGPKALTILVISEGR